MQIVTFFGSDHKVGTSMLSHCCAEALAERNAELKVLLIHMEGQRGDDYCPCVSESMEQIRPYLTDRFIDAEDILQKSRITENLFIIAGAETPGASGRFIPDMAEFFLKSMKEYFDVVICDCGSDLDQALTIGTLFSSEKTYCVITQSESSLRRFEWFRPMLAKLNIRIDRFLINKYSKRAVYGRSYIEKRLSVDPLLIRTVRLSGFGDNAEQDGKSLLNYGEYGIEKDIVLICKDIQDSING